MPAQRAAGRPVVRGEALVDDGHLGRAFAVGFGEIAPEEQRRSQSAKVIRRDQVEEVIGLFCVRGVALHLDTGLAGETGGRGFHHINDLSAAIQEAASDARVSYSLAFSPPAGSLDDSYHRLEVTVKRPDVKLRYRPGYVARRDGRGSGAGRGDRESCGAGRHRFHRASRSGGGGLQGVRDHRRAQHHAPTQGREVDRSLQFWWWWGRWSNLRRFR